MIEPLIKAAGAYPDIAMSDYHRSANLLPGPSLSSSGAKTILNQSPFHFWADSCLNPHRLPEKDASHFAVGKAAHDLILLGGDWENAYHVLPEGLRWNATVKFAEAIEAAEFAKEQGKTLIKHDDMELVKRIADRISASEDARNALINGVPELTLVWQDEKTGEWLRARPDFMPNSVINSKSIRIISDLKFMAPSHCTPDGFSKAIENFGYAISAAWYFEGVKQVYGEYPTHFLHVVIEKEPPHAVSLYWLPDEDLEIGRRLMRLSIDIFHECRSKNQWPGFADKPREVGLPVWARMKAEERLTRDWREDLWGDSNA